MNSAIFDVTVGVPSTIFCTLLLPELYLFLVILLYTVFLVTGSNSVDGSSDYTTQICFGLYISHLSYPGDSQRDHMRNGALRKLFAH